MFKVGLFEINMYSYLIIQFVLLNLEIIDHNHENTK